VCVYVCVCVECVYVCTCVYAYAWITRGVYICMFVITRGAYI